MRLLRIIEGMHIGKALAILVVVGLNLVCQMMWSRAPHPLLINIVLALYTYLLLDRFLEHREDLFDADKIFLVFAGYYFVLPTALSSFDFQQYSIQESQLLVNNPLGLWAIIAALAGLCVGLKTGVYKVLMRRLPVMNKPWQPQATRTVAYAFIAIGFLLFASLIFRVGLGTYLQGDYLTTYGSERGQGYLAAGIFLIEIGTILLFAEAAQMGKKPVVALLVAAAMALFFLRIGRRRVLLEETLALASIYHFGVRRFSLKTMVIGAATLVCLFAIVGQTRAYMAEGWDGMKAYLIEDLAPSELWTFLDDSQAIPLSIHETVAAVPASEPFAMGRTYLQALPAMAPLKLYPNRPLSPSEYFVFRLAPQYAAEGGGFSFSHVAEAYMNFGLTGVVAVYALIGALLRSMVEYRRQHPSIGRVFLHAVLLTATVAFIRGDSHGFLKVVMICTWVPAVAAALLLERRHALASRSRTAVAG